jgi:hypothetical protein
MGLLKNLEQAAAKKLMRLFLNSQKYADQAVEDLEKAEKALVTAKVKAAEATQRQYEAAVEAAKKASEVAEQLSLDAKIAEHRAKQYQENI